MMAYKDAYHEDSDADDEYERSVITSPTLPPDFESSPTDSDPQSTEHTPTTFKHSAGGSHASPVGIITDWTAEQCADWMSNLGLSRYAEAFINEDINGEALIFLHHADLKELGITAAGHRLTLLKGIYDVKVKQNIPIEPDDYVPLSAESGAQDAAPTQDDIARIIRIIKDRDERIHNAETELRHLKDDLTRILDENKRLREEVLPLARMAKDRSQPLPTPDGRDDHTATLSAQERADPSAAALAASSNLTASITGGHATSPHNIPQPSPTSPAYSQHTVASSARYPRSESRSHADENASSNSTLGESGRMNGMNTWSSSTLNDNGRVTTPAPLSARPMRSNMSVSTPDTAEPPLSGGSTIAGPSSGGSSNPQVEIFKSFRVSIDDPCHKVLPVALKKYNITADWRQYALYIVHGDQERCLGLDEKPLILFKQLDKEGRKPMFMLRKHAAPQVGHVNTVVPPQSTPQAFDNGTQSWRGGSVQLPGGVL